MYNSTGENKQMKRREGRRVYLPMYIINFILSSFRRRCIRNNVVLAGILARSPFGTFPSCGQWFFAKGLVGTYSSGDCSGFTPDSLLRVTCECSSPKMGQR